VGRPEGQLPRQHHHRPAEDPGRHRPRHRTVTVEDANTNFRVYHGEHLLTEVVRATTKTIAR
jgi:hypothetical protein